MLMYFFHSLSFQVEIRIWDCFIFNYVYIYTLAFVSISVYWYCSVFIPYKVIIALSRYLITSDIAKQTNRAVSL